MFAFALVPGAGEPAEEVRRAANVGARAAHPALAPEAQRARVVPEQRPAGAQLRPVAERDRRAGRRAVRHGHPAPARVRQLEPPLRRLERPAQPDGHLHDEPRLGAEPLGHAHARRRPHARPRRVEGRQVVERDAERRAEQLAGARLGPAVRPVGERPVELRGVPVALAERRVHGVVPLDAAPPARPDAVPRLAVAGAPQRRARPALRLPVARRAAGQQPAVGEEAGREGRPRTGRQGRGWSALEHPASDVGHRALRDRRRGVVVDVVHAAAEPQRAVLLAGAAPARGAVPLAVAEAPALRLGGELVRRRLRRAVVLGVAVVVPGRVAAPLGEQRTPR